jgi:methionyl-tRNA formyltransferase
MDKIKVACFGLQGFGNNLLQSLQDDARVAVTALYTRQTSFDFGYYRCETLETIAGKTKVPVVYVPDKGSWSCEKADLAIISSFHRIFRKEHLAKFRYTVNIHPSLLPAYKGATPTNWMIRNGERIAGLSAHLVDDGIDTGEVLFQRKLLNPFLFDNQLRKALAFLSEELVRDIIGSYPHFPSARTDPSADSFFPPRTPADALLKLDEVDSLEQLIFHIKAFTNFPMPKLLIGNKVFVVDYENPRESLELKVKDERFSVLGYWE